MVDNIVGKGENAGFQHFLLFPHIVFKACFAGLLCGDCVVIDQMNDRTWNLFRMKSFADTILDNYGSVMGIVIE